uniref:Uncharacterized protein n=1 Tax=Trichobilharzia regenti TaxID=157069 RepID=A0AA85JNJ5_TRIRE|nr:unnamed protein product [Trichobilharzia regenti]
MICSCCFQNQNANSEPSANPVDENVEDGDILQEIGNAQYTLDFLRQVVQRSTITHDESPPPYEDFNKYPKLSKSESSTHSCPSKTCIQQPQQITNINCEQFVNSAAPAEITGAHWIEPFPKPQGDPPPAVFDWLRNRFGSFRQSLLSRLSFRSSHLTGSSLTNSRNHSITPSFMLTTDVIRSSTMDQSELSTSESTTASSVAEAAPAFPILSTPNEMNESSSSTSNTSSVTHESDAQNVTESSISLSNINNAEQIQSSNMSKPTRILVIHENNVKQASSHQTNLPEDNSDPSDDDDDDDNSSHSMTHTCTDSCRMQNLIVQNGSSAIHTHDPTRD